MLVGKDNKVMVYSKQNCPQCVVVKKQLKNSGVQYVEVSIDEGSPEARHWLLGKGHRSVPVVYVDGVHIANPFELKANGQPESVV